MNSGRAYLCLQFDPINRDSSRLQTPKNLPEKIAYKCFLSDTFLFSCQRAKKYMQVEKFYLSDFKNFICG